MALRRAFVFPVLLAIWGTLVIQIGAAENSATTVWPPTGAGFPPPSSVPVWRYDDEDLYLFTSYTYDGHRLASPFLKTVTTKNATLCFHECAKYQPKDVKKPNCQSWQYDKKKQLCSFNKGKGCTVYSTNTADCVKWYTAPDKNYISGWKVFPLQ